MTSEKRYEEFVRGALNALQRASESALKLARETKTPFCVWRDGKCLDLLAEENAPYADAVGPEPVRLREEPNEDSEEETE